MAAFVYVLNDQVTSTLDLNRIAKHASHVVTSYDAIWHFLPETAVSLLSNVTHSNVTLNGNSALPLINRWVIFEPNFFGNYTSSEYNGLFLFLLQFAPLSPDHIDKLAAFSHELRELFQGAEPSKSEDGQSSSFPHYIENTAMVYSEFCVTPSGFRYSSTSSHSTTCMVAMAERDNAVTLNTRTRFNENLLAIKANSSDMNVTEFNLLHKAFYEPTGQCVYMHEVLSILSAFANESSRSECDKLVQSFNERRYRRQADKSPANVSSSEFNETRPVDTITMTDTDLRLIATGMYTDLVFKIANIRRFGNDDYICAMQNRFIAC